jgi:hypothetical protein
MLTCEPGLAGIRPVVLDHRGLYNARAGTTDPPKPAPRSTYIAHYSRTQAIIGPTILATILVITVVAFIVIQCRRGR